MIDLIEVEKERLLDEVIKFSQFWLNKAHVLYMLLFLDCFFLGTVPVCARITLML